MDKDASPTVINSADLGVAMAPEQQEERRNESSKENQVRAANDQVIGLNVEPPEGREARPPINVSFQKDLALGAEKADDKKNSALSQDIFQLFSNKSGKDEGTAGSKQEKDEEKPASPVFSDQGDGNKSQEQSSRAKVADRERRSRRSKA